MRKILRLVAVFTCVHAILAITCLLVSFGASMRSFDGGAPESAGEHLAARIATVLFLPGSLVWTRWASENLPNAFEWLLFVANSVLWGLLVALVVVRANRQVAAP